jgi:hypothetical protein
MLVELNQLSMWNLSLPAVDLSLPAAMVLVYTRHAQPLTTVSVLVVFNSSVPVSTPLPFPLPLPFHLQVGSFGRKRELSGS